MNIALVNDEQLADQLVALEFGFERAGRPWSTKVYWLTDSNGAEHDLGAVDTAVRSWLVAGALMDRLRTSLPTLSSNQVRWVGAMGKIRGISFAEESLPRAIIVECLKALNV